MKVCTMCNQEKTIEEMSKGKSFCKKCRNEKRRIQKQKHIPQFNTLKKCNTCGETKIGRKFSTCKESIDGLRGICKECYNFKATKRKFGIGREEYNEMLKEQDGKCKICCGDQPSRLNAPVTKFAIDHCHDTNKIRGLLCDRCNKALGMFEDNIELLNRASEYIALEGDI